MKIPSLVIAVLCAIGLSFMMKLGTGNALSPDVRSVQEGESESGGAFEVDKEKKLQDPEDSKLVVGDSAPEFSGSDLGGEMINLCDYRGKVVMVFFWGDWCPVCRSMYPEIQILAESMPDEHFKLIGINGNDSIGKLRSLRDSGAVNWQCISSENRDHNIAEKYGVHGWPSVYLLDAEGIIRYINPQRSREYKTSLIEAIKQMMADTGAGEEDLSIIFDKLESSVADNGK